MQVKGRGRLGRDPVTGSTKNGNPYARFSLADKNLKTNQTSWFNVTVYGNELTEYCKKLAKGTLVDVSGNLEVRDYQKKDGTKGTSVDVTAFTVQYVEFSNKPSPVKQAEEQLIGEEDVPF